MIRIYRATSPNNIKTSFSQNNLYIILILNLKAIVHASEIHFTTALLQYQVLFNNQL